MERSEKKMATHSINDKTNKNEKGKLTPSSFSKIDTSKDINNTKSSGDQLFSQTPFSLASFSNTPGKFDTQSQSDTDGGIEKSPFTMYEYMMGLRNISVTHEQYNEREALVTKPIEVVGNTKEIQLEATENHPIFDSVQGAASTRRTSVEYYVTYKDNPSLSDWLPILPLGEEKIRGERLFFTENQANLRFHANAQSIIVYKDNVEIDDSKFSVLSTNQISIPYRSKTSIYTVDYIPNKEINNPWTINMDDYKKDIKRMKETFDGTAFNKTIQLSHYPYVDYEKINQTKDYDPNTDNYSPIKVHLVNGSLSGKGNTRVQVVEPYNGKSEVYTYNKSLYKDKSWSEMLPYNTDPNNFYGGFDYYQWKDKVVFTETFNSQQIRENIKESHGKAQVEIHYDTLVSNFRLKAIVRRNTTEESSVSPEIMNYRLMFKTMK